MNRRNAMLAERIERKIFKDIAPKVIHFITPVDYRDARGLVATVYDQLLREFQFVPPITIHAGQEGRDVRLTDVHGHVIHDLIA